MVLVVAARRAKKSVSKSEIQICLSRDSNSGITIHIITLILARKNSSSASPIFRTLPSTTSMFLNSEIQLRVHLVTYNTFKAGWKCQRRQITSLWNLTGRKLRLRATFTVLRQPIWLELAPPIKVRLMFWRLTTGNRQLELQNFATLQSCILQSAQQILFSKLMTQSLPILR